MRRQSLKEKSEIKKLQRDFSIGFLPEASDEQDFNRDSAAKGLSKIINESCQELKL
jgi:hypothetical protein